MLTNFFLAILLTLIAAVIIISLDTTTTFMTGVVRRVLRMTHRSKLLTEYILRAYIRYRRSINKPLINNYY